ncbi:MAG: D-alanyl-D-alanine carboxypeptidase/D-alanyl-D-alanine endopeptidase [Janthinobacterium lividum]
MRKAPRRVVVGLAGAGVVLLLGAGYTVLDVSGTVPGPLTTTPAPTAPALPTAPAAVVPSTFAAAVLPGVSADAPVPDAIVLGRELSPLLADPALGASVSVSVVDALTGDTLLAAQADVARVPASVTKILTAAAALRALGPQTRATTEVVDGASAGEVVLVAGGDVLLAAGAGDPRAVDGHAGLDDLAARSATALLGQGRDAVTVRLDDDVFTGPATSPGWGSGDVAAGFVAPVSPLAVDEGRLAAGDPAPRAPDPAMAAAQTFARLLGNHGVRVLAAPSRAGAAPGATVLAQVSSATTAEQVESMLTTSDNTLAEVLARRVAVASGRPATFDDASLAIVEQVVALDVDVAGVTLQGGSGLGRATRIPARTLTELLALVAAGKHPDLAAIASGLPVAAVSGSLLERYDRPDDVAGAGIVRAKTGTLTGVSSLAGFVRDADGRLLAFAVMSDAVAPGGSGGARHAQDRFTTALAACGCR